MSTASRLNMHTPSVVILAALAASLITPGLAAQALSLQADSTSSQAAPDNSAHNKHHATTADAQPNATSDRQTTAKVRRAIMADKGLSTYAHNVKIITKDGAVTLKGPVKSDDEKQKVASIAAGVVTQDKVTDQLSVKQ